MPPETTRKPAAATACGQRLRVRDHLLLIVHELRLHRFEEADGLGRDHVHQRAALHAREDTFLSIAAPYFSRARIRPERGPRSVLCVVEVTISAYSHGFGCRPAATRPEKCAMSTSRNRADGIGNLAEAREIDDARIGAAARDDHLRLVFFGQARHVVVIDALVFLAHAVGDHVDKSCRRN